MLFRKVMQAAAAADKEWGSNPQDITLQEGSEESMKPPKPPREATSIIKPHFVKVMALSCDNDNVSIRHSVTNVISSSWPQAKDARHSLLPTPPAESKSQTVTLNEFVQRYSELLPCEIMVVEGANTPPVTLSSEDILNVHRICEQNMVLARANESQQYLIPLNAAVEFCVLYDPESNISKALKGYSFEKVSDLMSVEVRPKLVCARSSWEDKDTNRVTINNREVFVVGDIVLPTKKKGKKVMKLYSITKQAEKILSEECIANFSTKPSLLPLYLAEITGYIRDPFPCKAVLHDEGLMVPPHLCAIITNLSGLVLNLVSMSAKRVLATTYKREGIENPIIMDIPVELPQVKVKVLHANQYDEMDFKQEASGSKVAEEINLKGNDTQVQDQNASPANDEEHYEVMVRARVNNVCATNMSELKCQVQNKILTKQPMSVTETLRPDEFAKQYGGALPIQVRITESSQTVGGTGLHRDEIYNVHLVTETDGISMTDEKGLLVLVPTHSSTQFGVIFNPQADLDKAVSGYMFESVEDVVKSVHLPRVLCATEAYKSSSPVSSVDTGEVLIVNDAEISPQSMTAILTVYSINKQMTKKLQADGKGHFVTDPSRIKLQVSVILQHLATLLPICALMYPDEGHATSGPAMVTLLGYHPKSVLVATTVYSPTRDGNPYQPVEIPLDAAVKMVAMPNTATMTTGSPHCGMKSLSLEHGGATFAPLGTRRTQPPIVPKRSKVRKNTETPPTKAARNHHTVSATVDGQSRDSHYSSVDAGQLQQCENELKSTISNVVAQDLSPATRECETHAQNLGPQVEELPGNEGCSLHHGVETTSLDKFKALNCDVAELVKQFAVLSRQIGNMEKRLEETNDLLRMRDEKTGKLGESEQRKFVESLTSHQVLRLLDAAGLGAYSESFDREKIDGQLLCMLNDTLLQQDLNVSSSLHRLKLLGIISGTVDVRSWFT
ncbi:hypothetical protein EMCRGX_G006981 [Ephydatia muelleri]